MGTAQANIRRSSAWSYHSLELSSSFLRVPSNAELDAEQAYRQSLEEVNVRAFVEAAGRNPSYPSRPLDSTREIRLESCRGIIKRYTCCERVPILSLLSDLNTRSVAEGCTSKLWEVMQRQG